MTLGRRLRLLRNEKGMTLREIGELFNIGKSTVSDYENDNRKPDYEMLKKFAEYYSVTVDYLVGSSSEREHYNIDKETMDLINAFKSKLKDSGVDIDNKSLDEVMDMILDAAKLIGKIKGS